MATQTMTIDSQVHSYERNRPERPWATIPPWPGQVHLTGEGICSKALAKAETAEPLAEAAAALGRPVGAE